MLLDPRNIRAKKIHGSDVNQWIQKNNNKLRKFNLVDMKGRNGHRFGMQGGLLPFSKDLFDTNGNFIFLQA